MKKFLTSLYLLLLSAVGVSAETLWGYAPANYDFKGTGYEYAGSYSVCMQVPASAGLSGMKIVAFNVPAKSSRMKAVQVWGGTSLGDRSLLNQDCSSMNFPAGYVRVNLTSPITIPSDGMYVGYSYDIEEIVDIYDSHSVGIIRTDNNPVPGSLYVAYSLYGNQWEDWSAERASALQLVLDSEEGAKDYVVPGGVSSVLVVKGQQGQGVASLRSYSSKPLTSVAYEVQCGDQKTSGQKTFSPAVEAGLNVPVELDFSFNVPSAVGHYEATFTVTQINGSANSEASNPAATFDVDVLARAAHRMCVVEEVTGTACGWCPSGYVMMEKIRETCGSTALPISVHWFNNYSPLYVADYDEEALPKSSAPLCMVDRRTPLFDPYSGYDGANVIGWIDQLQSTLPEVDITATAEFDPSGASDDVMVTAQVEYLTAIPGSNIAYVLTADGLTGTAGNWLQMNNYASLLPDQYPALSMFCSGGEYGQSTVRLTYNDVMVASSWKEGGTSVAPTLTKSGTIGTENVAPVSLSLPMSRKQLMEALQLDKLYATVMVIKADGTIANAVRCHVQGEPEGLRTVMTANDESDAQKATYDLQGRRAAAGMKGVLIEGGHKVLR